MRIPDDLLKPIVFIALRRNSGMHVGGTGFLLIEQTDDSFPIHFLITAAHVIRDDIANRSIDGKVHVRANVTGSGADFIETDLSQWVCHEDGRIDVAAIAVQQGGEILDHSFFGTRTLVTDEVIATSRIGPGTDLVFPGLFTEHFGTERNITILRTGTIAAMPSEPIATKTGLMPAYLAEARSIGGLSGSPVFCIAKNRSPNVANIPVGADTYHLLGLIQGHYGVDERNWDSATSDSLNENSVNMGIAIIVRAHEIAEVIRHERFNWIREKARNDFVARQQAQLD
jgi:hypothetical protein